MNFLADCGGRVVDSGWNWYGMDNGEVSSVKSFKPSLSRQKLG